MIPQNFHELAGKALPLVGGGEITIAEVIEFVERDYAKNIREAHLACLDSEGYEICIGDSNRVWDAESKQYLGIVMPGASPIDHSQFPEDMTE